MSEAEEEDSQAQAERPVARSFDSLVKPAVPSRCASEDMESFCPAGHWQSGELKFMVSLMADILLLTQIFSNKPPLLGGMLILNFQVLITRPDWLLETLSQS